MKILVVDDDSLAAEMTGAVLESAGHAVVISENGIEAMEMLEADSGIALVVSDLNMPLCSGIELFETLRGQGNKVPFILLTGDDPQKALSAAPGLDGCVMKDASLDESLPAVLGRLFPN